jgi:flagellar FliL protein
MSDKKDKEAKPKKGGGMMMKIGMAVGLIAVGGGGAYGLVAAGSSAARTRPRRKTTRPS